MDNIILLLDFFDTFLTLLFRKSIRKYNCIKVATKYRKVGLAMEMEYSSNGKGNLGVTLGAIGTGLGILNGGLGLLGMPMSQGGCHSYITREEAELQHQISAKDSEIALLKADSNTENKMIDVYTRVMTSLNTFRDQQTAINSAQAVANNQMSNQIAINMVQAENSPQPPMFY